MRTAKDARQAILRPVVKYPCREMSQVRVVCRAAATALRWHDPFGRIESPEPLMNVVEKIFAATMVVLCLLLLARMVLRPRRRARFDASLKKSGVAWQRRIRRAVLWPAAELRARRETKEAIRRARRSAIERDGNVITPKAFKGRRRDLH
jgi:hypothetical protein